MFYRAAGWTSGLLTLPGNAASLSEVGRKSPRPRTQFTVSIIRKVAPDSGTVQKEYKLTSCRYSKTGCRFLYQPAFAGTTYSRRTNLTCIKHGRPIADGARTIPLIHTAFLGLPSNQHPGIATRLAGGLLHRAYEARCHRGFRNQQRAARCFVQPGGSVVGFLRAFAPARVAEVGDGTVQVQQELLFVGE